MKLEIESTPQTLLLDGVPVRLWTGRMADGNTCTVFVHRLAMDSGLPAPADLDEQTEPAAVELTADSLARTLTALRSALIAHIELHERTCPQTNCTEKGNMLAWLAHSIGAGPEDLRVLPRLLLQYDIQCAGCGSPRDQ